jgi:hypothetical protein
MPEPELVAVAVMFPVTISSVSRLELLAAPIPGPPLAVTDPFSIVKESHRPPSPVPSPEPAAFAGPVADRELEPIARIVKFEPAPHSSPACPDPVDVNLLEPDATNVTELPEMSTAMGPEIVTSASSIKTSAFVTSMKLLVDVPVTKMMPVCAELAVLQAMESPVTRIDPWDTSQIIYGIAVNIRMWDCPSRRDGNETVVFSSEHLLNSLQKVNRVELY